MNFFQRWLNHTPPPMFFLHIPKTAGISLYDALRDIYGANNTQRWQGGKGKDAAAFKITPASEIERFRFVTGHIPLQPMLEKQLGPRLTIAVIRNPVERFLSQFHYIQGWPEHPFHEQVRHLTLAEYAEEKLSGGRGNAQCAFLSGEQNYVDALEVIEQEIDVLGCTEQLNVFTDELGTLLGNPIGLAHRNKTAGTRPRQNQLDEKLQDYLVKSTEEDYKLWSHVNNSNGLFRSASRQAKYRWKRRP